MSFLDRIIESIRVLFAFNKTERAAKQSEHILKQEEQEEKHVSEDLKNEEELESQEEDVIENLKLISNALAAILNELSSQNEEGYRQYLAQLAHDEDMLKKQLTIFLQQIKNEQNYEGDATKRIEQMQRIGERVSQLGTLQEKLDEGAIATEKEEIKERSVEDKKLLRIETDKGAILAHLESNLKSRITTLCATLRTIESSGENTLNQGTTQAQELYSFLCNEELLLRNMSHWTTTERDALQEQEHRTRELELIERTVETEIKEEEERRREDAGAKL